MDMFKKKSLCTALAGIGTLGAVGAAQAVNLDPDGLGQVLIYPYYTVRASGQGPAINAFASLLSVVNSTASTKAVKVRFLEGRNSREVLDFNLYLSAKDVWTTVVTPEAAGAKITTTDKSCTLPPIPAAGVTFRNTAYASDGAGAGLDRTREGYVEIIEMASYSNASQTTTNVTHVSGVPPGCAAQTDALGAAEAQPPTGGLFGGISLINVLSGMDITESAVAIDRFSNIPIYTAAGVDTPNMTFASPPQSIVVANNTVYQSTWTPGTADPVSAVLMQDQIMNEYVLDAATKSGTDWVVTMPTKRFYIANGTGTPARLFQRNFNGTVGACDDVSLNIYDREEQTTSTPIDFSPLPPAGVNALCWEANVVTFNNSNLLGSQNSANITTTFPNGWLTLGFFPSSVTGVVHTLGNAATTRAVLGQAPSASGPATYFGLPVVGFAAQSFNNGTLTVGTATNVQSSYAGAFVQKGTRRIQ